MGTYNKKQLDRLAHKKSFLQIEREAIQDGVVTEREAKEMLEAYDRENFERDKKILERFDAYGYHVWIDPRYQINVAKPGEEPQPVIKPAPAVPFHIKYQKHIFAAIVGAAEIICLVGLL